MSGSISVNKIYETFAQKSDLVYRFISLQNEYANLPRDYGSGTLITMMEVHTLTEIEENPGITITELAASGRKTKGAVSQTTKRLEEKGLIQRKPHPYDKKKVPLYATEEGKRLSRLHKKYDIADLKDTLDELLHTCEISEVDAFFKVVSAYVDILEREL